MDLLQLLMQQFCGDLDDVIKKFTNKHLLIEDHEAALRKHEIVSTEDSGLVDFRMTTTTELKSLPPVPLHPNNCITLDALLESIDVPVTGKFLLCRSLCPPIKMNALFTIVDDPDGKLGVRISLYNFVRNMSHRRPKDVYQYLPVGTILAIMNPWFKKTADGGLTIRCDNPAEVVILDQAMVKGIIGSLLWKGEIPVKYRRKELLAGDSIVDWKISGNEHFSEKRFHDAIQAYTNGINGEKSATKNKVDLLANRSAAYLALKKFKLGLVDAESVLIVDKSHIKCMFRKAKALFGLAEYENALIFLTGVSLELLSNTQAKIIDDLIVKAKSFIAQSKTGDYPWIDIFQNQFDELAEFAGPVIVKNAPKKGRGLFATEAIKAGQLILASKAFARVVGNRPNEIFFNMRSNQKTGRKCLNDRLETQLITEIAHILKESPEKCREVYNLYAGPELSSQNELIASHEIDMQRIEAICLYNQFGVHNLCTSKDEENHCGLWLSPSYINHSCVDSNSSWFWKKDFLFVSAYHDIAEGEEILISYVAPLGQSANSVLKTHNFVCDCRFCIRELQDNSIVQAKRSDLMSRLDAILKKYDCDSRTVKLIPGDIKEDDHKMTMILESLSDLRKDAPELNIPYAYKMEMVANVYLRNGQLLEGARTLEKVYKILANIPAFFLLTANISCDIVASYILIGETQKMKEWIPILKRDCALAYGTWKVIEVAFPLTFKQIQASGISLSEM